jgi:ABC-type uncharacterized transport system permease subunit
MERLTVLCFAGTYGLALIAELARFWVRSPARWYATVGLTFLAWLVQTTYLANLALVHHTIPVTTAFESVMVLSWIVALIGLYLMVQSTRQAAVGLFVLPLVIGLATVAAWSAPRESDWRNWGGLTAFWGTVHGIFLLGGAVFSCLAFAAGLMYLAQSHRLKSKRPARFGLALPSLEQSERVNRGAITLAFPLLTFGLVIGVILGLAAHRQARLASAGAGTSAAAAHAASLSWTDPKVVSTVLTWGVFAVLLHARYRPAMRGRGVMVLSIVAFAFLVFTWVGISALSLPTTHNVRRTPAATVEGSGPGRGPAPIPEGAVKP